MPDKILSRAERIALKCDQAHKDMAHNDTCTRCGEDKPDVERQFSFGIYAGRMCNQCAYDAYRDHCGLSKNAAGEIVEEGEQGAVEDLDEFQRGGYVAITGEE